MGERETRATVSKGRESLCITFRHPVARAVDGKSKLRVRRGLGTADQAEANGLVAQMNEILSDASLHTLSARQRLAGKFDTRIVSAFYDYLDPVAHDAWAERERVIPIPERALGYAKVLFVGTTGSGKTTLLRQFIGTDPEKERFPSTSAAKTTTADIDVILADGPYCAVVSFVPQEHVRLYVTDCLVAAVAGHFEGVPPAEIVRRFTEHSDQRFRLNYLLGSPSVVEEQVGSDQEDEEFFDDEPSDVAQDSELTDEQRRNYADTMNGFLARIAGLATEYRADVLKAAQELGVDLDHARSQDREAIRDLVEEKLIQGATFEALVDDIMDEIDDRFAFVEPADFARDKDGWPVTWTFRTDDRSEFIRTVNRFSSNYAPNFGRLLTPIVDGIRVQGPFRPGWHDEVPKLVFLDGQGIGHTADSSASISTAITRRFSSVDAIVLVDNAAQPMQAGSVAVLKSIVTSGHESKLIVCFTHFDDVKGDNLPNASAKRAHVTSSFFNAVHALGQQLGREAEQSLQRLMDGRLVFVADIQDEISDRSRTAAELRKLSEMIAKTIEPTVAAELQPVYDIANLVLAIQKATQVFHQRWRGILTSEHWARIKALTRRLGLLNQDEYDQLRPVADLILQLQTSVYAFLCQPMGWLPPTGTDERVNEKTQVTDSIRQLVSTRLHDLARHRVLETKNKNWSDAFYRRGLGSTLERARDIRNIYDAAAPIPAEMADEDATAFMFDVRVLVAEAIKDQKGIVKGWEP